MKKTKKWMTICVSFASALTLTLASGIQASALGIGDFRVGDDGPGKVVTTLEQTDKGLHVVVKNSSNGDRRNVWLDSEKIPIKPAKVEYSIDKTTYTASPNDGYHFFGFFKDLATSKTAGFVIMVYECPVGFAESFQWMPESAKGKTWVILQDIMGNKVHEVNPNLTTENNPEGSIDYGYIIDTPYVGSHSFTYDSVGNKVIFDGVTIPIQPGAAKRIGMGDSADMVIQAGGNVYGKEIQYTVKTINGVKVDGSNASLNPKPTQAPTTAPPAPTKDSGSSPEPTQPAVTPNTTDASQGDPSESSANTDSATPATEPQITEAAPAGQKLGVKSLNTAIDFEANLITLKKSYTVGELMDAFVRGEGYDFRICDSSGKIISDESRAVDDTMKLQLYFGSEPEQTFSLLLAQTTDSAGQAGFPWWIFLIIGGVLVVAGGGAAAFFLLKKKKAAGATEE